MKRYRKPSQLIYQPVGIMEKMVLRWKQHMKGYGKPPERIYLPKDVYKEYTSIIPNMYKDGPLYFRGVTVHKL